MPKAAILAKIPRSQTSDLRERVRKWSRRALDLVYWVDPAAELIALRIDLPISLYSGGEVVCHVLHIYRRGVEGHLVPLGERGDSSDAGVDPPPVNAIVRDRQWFEDLEGGRARSPKEIAEDEGVSAR